MKTANQFHVGQILTLKNEFLTPSPKDFHFSGKSGLFLEIEKVTKITTRPTKIKARVYSIRHSIGHSESTIIVDWLNPFSSEDINLGLKYQMKQYEFEEYVDTSKDSLFSFEDIKSSSKVIAGHSHFSPDSYTHMYDLGTRFDPITFEEIKPETQLSFKPTKLVANEIQNSKEIDNFLLLD